MHFEFLPTDPVNMENLGSFYPIKNDSNNIDQLGSTIMNQSLDDSDARADRPSVKPIRRAVQTDSTLAEAQSQPQEHKEWAIKVSVRD